MPDQLIDWEKWERIAEIVYKKLSTKIAMNTWWQKQNVHIYLMIQSKDDII